VVFSKNRQIILALWPRSGAILEEENQWFLAGEEGLASCLTDQYQPGNPKIVKV
jgi:hypothetical protein